MPKIKLTKTELKTQQDALRRFQRFLPTLQLKKQQLQVEIRGSIERLEKNTAEYEATVEALRDWIALFGEDAASERLGKIVQLTEVVSETWNIAGVEVPLFKSAEFMIRDFDAYAEDPWFVDAVECVEKLIALIEGGKLIREQHRLLHEELLVTTQRVNLFEKVKIPEARENIRRIRIFLSDVDTSNVVRSKIAKNKSQEVRAV